MARRRVPATRTLLALAVVLATAVTAVFAVTPSSSAQAPPTGGLVWTKRANPDGTTTFSVYRTARGYSVDQLYASLRSAGVPNLVDPAATQSLAAVEACTYGTAATLWCNPIVRWDRKSFGDPQVYFRDSSGAVWPVNASVTEWNKAVGADSYYLGSGSACPAASTGKHCVNVYSAYYTWTGASQFTFTATYNSAKQTYYFVDGTAVISFNNRFSSSDDNRGTVCQELGHALGVGHNSSTGSCMYPYAISGPNPRYPNSADYSLIRYRLYPD